MESKKESTILTSLFIFGVAYNAFVSWLERQGYDRGYTAILVVVGTLVTVVGAGLRLGTRSVAWILTCFAASGTPMIAGSIWRYVAQRQRDLQRIEMSAWQCLRGGDNAKAQGGGVSLQSGAEQGFSH